MSQPFPNDPYSTPNPYSPPNPMYGALQPKPTRSRPGYLSFLCVVSVILGCLGALRGGCTAVSAAGGGNPFRQQRDRAAEMPPALQETFRKFEAEGNAIDARYSLFNKSTIIVQAILGLVMVGGALLVLQAKRPGDWVLRGAFAATLLVSLASMVPFVFQMLEMRPLLDELSQKGQQLGGEDAMAANVMIGVMSGIMYGGICVGSLWLALKLALFGHGIYYLGTPAVQETLH
jgi:hypothetical protein